MAKAWRKLEVAGPTYPIPEPNGTFSLGKEKVRLTVEKKSITATADVLMRLLPSPRVLLQVPLSDPADGFRTLAGDSYVNVHFPARKMTRECFRTRLDGAQLTLTPTDEPMSLGSPRARLKTVTFHLLNFPVFSSDKVTVAKVGKAMHRLDHVALSAEGWRIILSSLPTTREHVKFLKDNGGYALTHAGRLAREDGRSFAGRIAGDMLIAVHHYLSFARGLWSSPSLAVGTTESGRATWRQWGAGQCNSWRYVHSWFDAHCGTSLEEAFPGFLRRWTDPLWQKPLSRVIYWYLASNQPQLDGGIVLTQAGLEQLAWVYAVHEQKLISKDGFNKLRASDRLLLLCSSLGLPIEIPACLTRLTGLARAKKWPHAMQAFTEIRNSIVHPQHKRRGEFEPALYEAWNLGLWYLELLLLRLCGYNGVYGNRLVQRYAGEVEHVPWSPKAGR